MANWNEILETAIIGKVVTALIKDEFRLEMSDQDGGGLFIYAWSGNRRPVKFEHWVRLVPGNGADVIVDYTTNLEAILKPVNDFAAQFAE